MNKKIVAKKRRSRATRAKIADLGVLRLCVHRTLKHMYVQLIESTGMVLASASTREQAILKACKNNGGNVDAAKVVGQFIAERAQKVLSEREEKSQVVKLAFDRSGFKYHGRIKALADSAREAGLIF